MFTPPPRRSRCHPDQTKGRRRDRRGPWLALVFAVCICVGLGSQPRAQDAGAVPGTAGSAAALRGTYGAWQLYCRTPPGARQEKCAIVQMVTDEERPNVGLNVQLFKSIGDNANMMRVVAPLGIFLPRGLGVKIDGEDVGNAPYIKCGKNSGCIAEFELQDEVVSKFKSGDSALLIIFPTVEEGIGIPVSLEGFTKAFATLK